MLRPNATSRFILISLCLLFVSTLTIAGPLEDKAREIQKLAEQGDAKSQSHLGYLYYVGEGVEQDYAKAVEWYRKAATQGDRDAQYNLAVAYAFGEGAQQDLKEAGIWYRRAAEQGHVISQYSLGLSYAYGEGVPQDSAEAVRWFTRAAEQGYVRAQVQLGSAYHTGEGVEQDYAEAIKWYRMAADRGDATAQYNLGTLYRSGKGVDQDYNQAIRWFTMAADQGYVAAQNELASLQRTAGRVATRPTPQIRPGSNEAAASTTVASSSAVSSPVATTTVKEAEQEAKPAPSAEPGEAVAVTQKPVPLQSASKGEINKPITTAEEPDAARTRISIGNTQPATAAKPAEGGGLFGALGKMFSSTDTDSGTEEPMAITESDVPASTETPVTDAAEPDDKPAAEPVMAEVDETTEPAAGTAMEQEPEPAETVAVVSNMPQTDEVVRAESIEAQQAPAMAESSESEAGTVETDDEPGFFSRLFGNKSESDSDVEQTTAVTASGDSETDTASTTSADSAENETEATAEVTVAEDEDADSVSDDAAMETGSTSEPASLAESGAEDNEPGFFARLFGSSDEAADAASVEDTTVAMVETPDTTEKLESAQSPQVDSKYSVEAGRRALANGDYDKALSEFRPLAEAGDPEAQSHLASMYYVGRAVDKDYSQAFQWYNKAAMQGHMDSQYSIGNMYLLGEGVEQDNQQAAIWYNKAALQGHVAAAHNLQSLKSLMAQSGQTLEIPEPVEVASFDASEAEVISAMESSSADSMKTDSPGETLNEPVVPVTSNMPETDAYVRTTNMDEETPVMEETPVAVMEEESADEPVADEAEPEEKRGFFSRLFGSDDDSNDNVTTDVAMVEDGIGENETEETPVTSAQVTPSDAINPEEPTDVKTYGISNAPLSQQLTSEPGPDADEETLTVAAADTAQADMSNDTDAIAVDEEDVTAEEISTADSVDVASADDTTEPASGEKTGFFARLFGADEKEESETTVAEEVVIETGSESATPADSENVITDTTTGDDDVEQIAESMGATGEFDDTTAMSDEDTDTMVGGNTAEAGDDEFAFFDRMFSQEDTGQPTVVANTAIREPVEDSSPEVAAVADTVAEPEVHTPETEPADYITEFEQNPNTGDTRPEIDQVQPLATRGDADAQLQLGDMYYTGSGVGKDYTQAFLWYRRAAQQGNVDAQYKLGNIYLMGEGVNQDDGQAAAWYERAAKQGHEAAEHNLANLQRMAAAQAVARNEAAIEEETAPAPSIELAGTGPKSVQDDNVKPTVNEEEKGFWDSAGEFLGFSGEDEKQSSANTDTRLAKAGDDMDAESTARVTEAAKESSATDPQSLYDKGMAHAFGDGVGKDYQKAFEYFKQAADQGHAAAQYRLGVAYAYGEGVGQDLDKSIQWYRQAAQNGNTVAQRTLATMYLDGKGVPRDKVMAHAWYRIVASSGNVMDIRRRDMLQEELSDPELSKSEKIAEEINSRLPKL